MTLSITSISLLPLNFTSGTQTDGNSFFMWNNFHTFQVGNLISFNSEASNIHPNVHDNTGHIYTYNIVTHDIELVSSASDGTPGDSYSWFSIFTPDGSKSLIISAASNFDAADTNGVEDLYLKDLTTGTIQLISSDANGVVGNDWSYEADISPDGTYVGLTQF